MRIGVIGAAGKIGQMRVQTIVDNPDTTLAAVMDTEMHRVTAVANGAPTFTDADRFFDVEMNAVVISTPAHVREPLCLAAFERGLHVLAEKPLATTVEAGRRIVTAAKSARRALGAGFNMRYYPAFSHVKDVIESGQIGDIDHIRIYGGHEGLTKFVHDWEYKSDTSGGGALWDVGIHMTDMARHMLGEITDVYGIVTENVWNVPGSEDNAMAIFRNPKGTPAIYQATWTDWKGYKSQVEVYGNRGMVRGIYAPMETLLITMDRPGGPPTRRRHRYPKTMLREKLRSWKTTAMLSFADELKDFISLCAGQSGLRISDGHAALRAIEVAVAVQESSATGRPVMLDPLGDMEI